LSTRAAQSGSRSAFKVTRSEWIFLALFVCTLPLLNPWIRGDGVGYYAFARAPLIEHSLDFRHDWIEANPSFRLGRIDDDGNVRPEQFTSTGHLNNHFSIGPAILWAPFLAAAHAGVKLSNYFGSAVPADGFSLPYRLAMAFGTAVYGFLALCISFRWARKYVPEQWAFLATIAVWFASSLPVYMYFNPSWSHVHSAFTVALYFWYWDHTREDRGWAQWFILGALAGLMIDVYYVNAVLMIVPLLESIGRYLQNIRANRWTEASRLFFQNLLFAVTVFAGIVPTLISKKIIYGGYFQMGYPELWYWNSPAILKVGFSSEHGLFSWTPVLFLAVLGLFFVHRYDRNLSIWLVVAFSIYLYIIGSYEYWDGISSFGNRFFVSLTPLFILGLAALLDTAAGFWSEKRTAIFARSATALLILWNLGLIFQWGTHLIPARGPISWRKAVYNQVAVVPEEATLTVYRYMTQRRSMMGHIEQEDVGHIKTRQFEKTH
jgi:hypothetical protein